jgi:hypothetical protein
VFTASKRTIFPLFFASAFASFSCSESEPPRSNLQARARPSASVSTPLAPHASSKPTVYPPGRWRWAADRELESSVIWVSHILIRHSRSDMKVMGNVFDWRLDTPPPDRTREQALALANGVASELRARPDDFPLLARRHSEDPTSAALGGSVGGARASDYRFEPEVLDAIAALSPGQTSAVVETRHGFQIFRLGATPDAGNVSGEHIVLGHEGARWLDAVGCPPPRRTRSEALALAQRIHAELSADPASFAAQVREHSDYPDQASGGDLGTWSVREPTFTPRAVDRLRTLPIGGISAPFENHYGIEIVRRTPDRTRPLYAMEAIVLAFAAGDARSKREALTLAQGLSRAVKERPSRFDELRAKYCCRNTESWQEGRDDPALSQTLAKLEPGEIPDTPLLRFGTWVIPKRIDPSRLPVAPVTRFAVPAPERPTLEWILSSLSERRLAQEIVEVAGANPSFATNDRRRDLLQRVQRNAEVAEASNDVASRSAFAASVRELFEGSEMAENQTLLEARIGEKVLASALPRE